MAKYQNYFYNPKNTGSSPVIETEAQPVEYKDFFIYQRFNECFDIVHRGVCIGMLGSEAAAKKGY